MDQKIIDLFDTFTHSAMDRREFMAKLARIAGGVAAAAALMPLLEGGPAMAAITAPDDTRLRVDRITHPGRSGPIKAYLARPKSPGDRPGVVVIHENRGLNAHIEDVARRLALEGFDALAPDALSPKGGTPADSDQARSLIYTLDRATTIADFVAAVTYMKTRPGSTGKIGCVGFCWGGSMSNQLAVNARDLSAAVVYYGGAPAADDVPRIKAALLLNYAGLDRRIGAGIPGFEAALRAARVRYTKHVYAGANHAFNNDTRPARYHAEAARLAWRRTVAFLKAELG